MDMRADVVTDGRGEHGRFLRYLPRSDFELSELLRRMWRRKLLISICALFLLAIGTAVILTLTPLYSPSVLVMIGSENNDTVALAQTDDQRSMLAAELPDSSSVETQGQILQSRSLAGMVVDKLDLTNDPEFNPKLQKPTWIGEKVQFVMGYVKQLRNELLGKPASNSTESLRDQVIDNVLSALDVTTVGKSRVLQVTFVSQNADKAALIANTLADFYLAADREARAKDKQRASDWLNERLADLRARVAEAEQQVQDFRTKSGMIQTKDVDLVTKDLSDLSTQLIESEAARAAAEAQLGQLESNIRAGKAESSGEVLGSALIQRLREQQSEAERTIAQLAQQYGDKHPSMLAAKASVGDIERKISVEVDRITDSVRGEVSVARSREQALRTRIEELKGQVGEMNNAQVKLDALEREATASRTLLENFLLRAQQLEGAVRDADAQVISPASSPASPSFPNRKILFALVLVAAIAFGVIVAITLEALESGFRSLEQVETTAGIPALALVPAVKGMRALGSTPEEYVLKKPGSAYSEAIRSVHTALLMAGLQSAPRRVLITSAIPGEGKTVTVTSLARMLASGGERVVVLDCDLRRPRVHSIFGAKLEPGIMGLLQGTATLEEAIVRDHRSPADLIPAGRSIANPTALLASDKMKELLNALSSRYDWILIDTSPVLALSDARILARQVDRVLFLVRWAETRRAVAMAGLRQIVDADAPIAGVVLSNVDIKRNAKYGYGDSGLYAGRLRKYYVG
jgi:polysaccharide biosynthesis transport protein